MMSRVNEDPLPSPIIRVIFKVILSHLPVLCIPFLQQITLELGTNLGNHIITTLLNANLGT